MLLIFIKYKLDNFSFVYKENNNVLKYYFIDSFFIKKGESTMKKAIFGIFLIIVLFVFSSEHTSAHQHGAYLSDRTIGYSNSNWMGRINDDARLSELSIPGTHNTMSNGPGGDIVRNQSLSLSTQLNAGIRYLDIRVRAIDGVFTLHHGPVYLNVNFGNVLNEVTKFLNQYPSETILMRIKQEHDPRPWDEFNRILNSYLENECYKSYFISPSTSNPSLKEIRGKILILRDFSQGKVGIPYNSFSIQDNYHMSTNWDLYSKWESVKSKLNYSNTTNGKVSTINYLSASGGSFPYFVASGHSSPGTSAPRLSTGLTHPGWAGTYPDFPRVNWFLGIATIAFEGTNILTDDYIKNQQLNHVGIVVADFPGASLIDSIISVNYKNSSIPIDQKVQLLSGITKSKAVSAMRNSSDVVLWDSDHGDPQRFIIKSAESKGANVFQIWNSDITKIVAWNRSNNKEVFMHPNENKDEHFWIFEHQNDGSYVITNYANPGFALDVNGSKTDNGTKLQVWPRHGGSNQKYYIY